MQVDPQLVQHTAESASRFLPHGFCYNWDPGLLWTHVGSDLLIGLSYVAISFTLVYLVRKGRHEFPFQGVFVAFGIFIVACGVTHFMEIVTLWRPDYWLSGAVKVVTAVASVTTAMFLPPLVPRALRTLRDARLSEERRVMAERAAALMESEQRFRTLAEALPQMVWIARSDGAVEYYNQRWYEYTGLGPEQASGTGWGPIVHPDDLARTLALWSWSAEHEEAYEVEQRLRRSDGEYRWMLTRAVPVRGHDGTVVQWFGSSTDVHAQKEAAEEMRRARDAAEEASTAKDQFMAMISHELRTPLNAVLGYADLIAGGLSGPVTETQTGQLGRIRDSTRHLLGIIDQIMFVARDAAGHTTPVLERVPLAEPLRAAADLAEPLVRAKGLALSVELPMDLPEVDTDPGMVRQIVLNLLSNAVKYTPAGTVHLSALRNGTATLVEVRDTGIGIAAENLERIFEPFWQADQTLTRRAEGTGLGLAVTRRLVHALGGEISVESTLGEGTTFTVRLPLETASRTSAVTPAAIQLPAMAIPHASSPAEAAVPGASEPVITASPELAPGG